MPDNYDDFEDQMNIPPIGGEIGNRAAVIDQTVSAITGNPEARTQARENIKGGLRDESQRRMAERRAANEEEFRGAQTGGLVSELGTTEAQDGFSIERSIVGMRDKGTELTADQALTATRDEVPLTLEDEVRQASVSAIATGANEQFIAAKEREQLRAKNRAASSRVRQLELSRTRNELRKGARSVGTDEAGMMGTRTRRVIGREKVTSAALRRIGAEKAANRMQDAFENIASAFAEDVIGLQKGETASAIDPEDVAVLRRSPDPEARRLVARYDAFVKDEVTSRVDQFTVQDYAGKNPDKLFEMATKGMDETDVKRFGEAIRESISDMDNLTGSQRKRVERLRDETFMLEKADDIAEEKEGRAQKAEIAKEGRATKAEIAREERQERRNIRTRAIEGMGVVLPILLADPEVAALGSGFTDPERLLSKYVNEFYAASSKDPNIKPLDREKQQRRLKARILADAEEDIGAVGASINESTKGDKNLFAKKKDDEGKETTSAIVKFSKIKDYKRKMLAISLAKDEEEKRRLTKSFIDEWRVAAKEERNRNPDFWD